jgi:hypothetical protein
MKTYEDLRSAAADSPIESPHLAADAIASATITERRHEMTTTADRNQTERELADLREALANSEAALNLRNRDLRHARAAAERDLRDVTDDRDFWQGQCAVAVEAAQRVADRFGAAEADKILSVDDAVAAFDATNKSLVEERDHARGIVAMILLAHGKALARGEKPWYADPRGVEQAIKVLDGYPLAVPARRRIDDLRREVSR